MNYSQNYGNPALGLHNKHKCLQWLCPSIPTARSLWFAADGEHHTAVTISFMSRKGQQESEAEKEKKKKRNCRMTHLHSSSVCLKMAICLKHVACAHTTITGCSKTTCFHSSLSHTDILSWYPLAWLGRCAELSLTHNRTLRRPWLTRFPAKAPSLHTLSRRTGPIILWWNLGLALRWSWVKFRYKTARFRKRSETFGFKWGG